MLRLDAMQLMALAVLYACACFVLAGCLWDIGALVVSRWRMRRPRRPRSTAQTCICPNEACEAEITVYVYPEQPETRDLPAFPAMIDTPLLCPACGTSIDNDTASRWLAAFLEAERDRLDHDEEEKRDGDSRI